jgi:hypothetical protein
MGYRVLNAEGELTAGDDVLDDVLKAAALLVNGSVVDENGDEVYESPGLRSAREAAQLETLLGVNTLPEE